MFPGGERSSIPATPATRIPRPALLTLAVLALTGAGAGIAVALRSPSEPAPPPPTAPAPAAPTATASPPSSPCSGWWAASACRTPSPSCPTAAGRCCPSTSTSPARASGWFTDAGAACESCHGPGSRHADSQAPKDIVQPGELSAELGLAVCAQRHGPRRPLFPILHAPHHFQPGQRYDDFYQLIVLLVGNERSGDFFTDGRPSTSCFAYQALLQSRCHLQGGATCLTCHTAPHAPSAPNEVQKPQQATAHVSVGSATCQQCHADVFAQGQRHTRHTAKAAQDCLARHMPPVVSSVLDKFADHALDVPAPENTTRHGIPNACNTCHAEATPESMAQALTRWWPQAGVRQQRHPRLADAFDEKTAAASRPALEAVLADTAEAPSLRGVAAKLLAHRFKKDAMPDLRAALKGTQDSLLRSDIIEGLGTTGRARPWTSWCHC